MISPADLAGYQAKAKGKTIPRGTKLRTGAPISEPEEQLAWQLTGAGIPYLRNQLFHDRRKWTMDFAIIHPLTHQRVLGVECEGWGRHQHRKGFEEDCEKYAEAMALGYLVLRFTPRQITEGFALKIIQKILHRAPGVENIRPRS